MKTAMQTTLMTILSSIALLVTFNTAYGSQLTEKLGSRSNLRGTVAVGAYRNSSCDVQTVARRADGYSVTYAVIVRAAALRRAAVFNARNYENALDAQGVGNKRLHMYISDDGSTHAVIYKGQSVLLSCVNLHP